ncbi:MULTISPECIES: hypothetical protein [unclassified Streptomyces]|uniref:hypothetical protein n=1 Tax=unclassified Streptomyces TaxID=2593676 RepID=UPI000DD612BA|nr:MULTISPECIES: hypothetical protein [unclassified Streptomyces]QZZ26537.1 hypothetical protein A7X85_09965 [Streptomyces sp. ST1015]
MDLHTWITQQVDHVEETARAVEDHSAPWDGQLMADAAEWTWALPGECPELLDLAHAHGITPDTLAELDRPQPPERKPVTGPRAGHWLTPSVSTSDILAALRKLRW